MKRIKVYIASAYTNGDVALNVRAQIDVANELMNMGFVPFAPLLTHFQHMVHPRSYDSWLIDYDFEWLDVCDCLLRIKNGNSPGADKEEERAEKNGQEVFYSIEELVKYYTSLGLI